MLTLHRTNAIGRRATLRTPHGSIETPFFLPVATGGAMRGIGFDDLESLGAQALLCNTYHLHLAPGEDVVAHAGGLHSFIGWNKPILTDSGGFQVFSLESIRTIEDHAVHFRSHRDGSLHVLGPRESMEIQHRLGGDIIVCFDECPPSTASRPDQITAVDRTLRWARDCKDEHVRLCQNLPQVDHSQGGSSIRPLLFGIVQGGLERDLREKCAQELIAVGFDGYAVGGLAVGETPREMHDVLDVVCPLLPQDMPRYLMGVGRLEQMRIAVGQGIDMFDCVLPMREARHGTVYVSDGAKLRIRKSDYACDHSPIDASSRSPLSRRHTRSYLSHLFRTRERAAERIACMQNIAVTLEFMESLRRGIEA